MPRQDGGSSSGLKYIPRNRRRRREEDRLHGAFAGGFSSGYFNTVGSREGWKPREDQPQQQQHVSDFMDEQDHNEWGGPAQVARGMATGDDDGDDEEEAESLRLAKGSHNKNKNDPSEDLFSRALSVSSKVVAPPKNVGQQLLFALGWRGSNQVFVPLKDPPKSAFQSSHSTSAEKTSDLQQVSEKEQRILSERRLRKIRIQQQRIHIPPPKLDLAGLGFEAHENAPEFQRYFEKKKRERAHAQEASRRVYKLSNILGEGNADDHETNKDKGKNDVHASYLEYETAQDFIGTKSASGFALNDDDDHDVFDNHPGARTGKRVQGKLAIDEDEYDTFIQDPNSDEDDHDVLEEERQSFPRERQSEIAEKEKSDLGGALAMWAMGDSEKVQEGQVAEKEAPKQQRLAMDGRPVLPGFKPALSNGGDAGSLWNKRFRGPDVPIEYSITPHEFPPDENPMVLQALARGTQLEADDAHRRNLIDQALESTAQAIKSAKHSVPKSKPPPIAASEVFQGLAQSMKDRFTTSSKQNSTEADSTSSPQKTKPVFTATRMSQLFAPNPLLCKRFHVPVPSSVSSQPESADTRGREQTFFEDQVLKAAEGKVKTKLSKPNNPAQVMEQINSAEPPSPSRPSMDVYRSIFDNNAGAESSSSEDEDDKDGGARSTTHPPNEELGSGGKLSLATTTKETPSDDAVLQSSSILHKDDSKDRKASPHDSLSDSDQFTDSSKEDRRRRRKKKSRKHERRKDKKRHKEKRSRRKRHYYSDDESDESIVSENDRERTRKHRKSHKSDRKKRRKERDPAEK